MFDIGTEEFGSVGLGRRVRFQFRFLLRGHLALLPALDFPEQGYCSTLWARSWDLS
ncbi:hypothetical protein M6B38_106540 [Iris pallida]|uniref:Uncharacterized protein n=1 Tax=Iris pallida TaxID=29817 RepID=A0AAX6ESN2_IRIPA|nr:hypothetical protein M6B38_106540 [Iris pallida]